MVHFYNNARVSILVKGLKALRSSSRREYWMSRKEDNRDRIPFTDVDVSSCTESWIFHMFN